MKIIKAYQSFYDLIAQNLINTINELLADEIEEINIQKKIYKELITRVIKMRLIYWIHVVIFFTIMVGFLVLKN